VALLDNGKPVVWRHVHTDGSYLSASDARVHLGLGQRTQVDILVEWPDGAKEVWKRTYCDSIITLRQGTGQPQ
jgi:hypothetical protein